MRKKIGLSCSIIIGLVGVLAISLFISGHVHAADGDWESGDQRFFTIHKTCHDGVDLSSVYTFPPPQVISNGATIDIGARLSTTLGLPLPMDFATRLPSSQYGPQLVETQYPSMTYHATALLADINNDGVISPATESFNVYFTHTKLLWSRHLPTGSPVVITHLGVGYFLSYVQDCWFNPFTVTQALAAPITLTQLDARMGFFPAADLAYRVDALPANGTLLLNGAPLAVGQSFTQDDILNNRLSYQHNGSATTSDTFTYTMRGMSRVSVTSNGAQGTGGASSNPSLSRDGRRVAFQSSANNLVANDTNNLSDIFVHDLSDGTTIRASVSTSNTQANGASTRPSLDGPGSAVAFESLATNLVTGANCETLSDTNGVSDVYRKFIGSGTINRVSISAERFGACDQANGGSYAPAISGDSIFVVFESDANNLVNKLSINDTNGFRDVFSYANGNETVRQSIVNTFSVYNTAAGAQAINGSSSAPAVADTESGPTGLIIAFESSATNLVSGDTNTCTGYPTTGTCRDIFVRDNYFGSKTVRVSVSTTGTQANGASFAPAISTNGRYVAFSSNASNLVANDTNTCSSILIGSFNCSDIFVRDRDTDNDGVFDESNAVSTTRVSVASNGAQANSGSFRPALSTYGRYVAFDSTASNLVSTDTNACTDIFSQPYNCSDVFVYDRHSSQTMRVSVSLTGTQGNNDSSNASISSDGSYIAFQSDASNLVPNDTNNQTDVFVHYVGFTSAFRIAIAPLPPRAYLPLIIR